MNTKPIVIYIIGATLFIAALALLARADTPPIAPEPIKPAGIKCNGQIIPVPANVQLPISCDEARAYRDGNYCAVEIAKIEKRLALAKKKCGRRCRKI